VSELERFAAQIMATKIPEDLFGDLGADPVAGLKRLFKRFARVCHEDLYGNEAEKLLARSAFVRLQELQGHAKKRIERGTYGSRSLGIEIVTKTEHYTLDTNLGAGDVSQVYRGRKQDGTSVIVKVSDHPTCNDFLKNEALALKVLVPAELLTTTIARYFPRVVDELQADRRAITVFEDDPGFVPLALVMLEYPKGVDPRHFVWIFKRLLTALDRAEQAGIVHGAVLPTNVLIRPKDHALKLVGWSFCLPPGAVCRTKSRDYKSWYPPEVDAKRPVSHATDVFMAAECMGYILGTDPGVPLSSKVPARFKRVLDACLLRSPGFRSSSAIEVYEAIDKEAGREYGPPSFVDLKLSLQGV
jgi:serine/threonine protein kinase